MFQAKKYLILYFRWIRQFAVWLLVLLGQRSTVVKCQQVTPYDPIVFHQLTDPGHYQKWLMPEDPIAVNVGLKLQHVGPMDEKKSLFNVKLHVYLSWADRRLALNRSDIPSSSPVAESSPTLEIDSNQLSRIWLPALHFANQNPLSSDILNGLSGPVSGVIDGGSGKVFVIKKTQFDATCQFNIQFYPMDSQLCSLEIESTSLSTRHVDLDWQEDPIHIPSDFQWSDFSLENFTVYNGRVNYRSAGSYERLLVTFQLRRHTTHYLFNIYLPSTLFVISSWSSFWIDIPAAPARVALVLTTMLTHVTSTKSIADQLPKSSLVSSLDIWIIMCTMFIFAAIIEYATANYFYHKPSRIRDKNSHIPQPAAEAAKTTTIMDQNGNLVNGDSSTTIDSTDSTTTSSSSPLPSSLSSSSTDGKATPKSLRYYWHRSWTTILPPFDEDFPARKVALEIDRRSRYLFPILFISFNIFYWTILVIYSG